MGGRGLKQTTRAMLTRELSRTVALHRVGETIATLEGYLHRLGELGEAVDLTAYETDEAVVLGLVLPALRAWHLTRPAPGAELLDLGAGNGAFAVTAALLHPESRVTALDSRRRVADFLSSVSVELQMSNLHVRCEQAEYARRGLAARFAIVGTRAMAAPSDALEMAMPFVAPGGSLLLWHVREHTFTDDAAARAGFHPCGQADLSDLALRLVLSSLRGPVPCGKRC